jgi:ABC-type spermidine/putrescine transport system permease subunit II
VALRYRPLFAFATSFDGVVIALMLAGAEQRTIGRRR